MWQGSGSSWEGSCEPRVENIGCAQPSPDVMLFFVFKTNLPPGVSQAWTERPTPCGGMLLLLSGRLSSYAFSFFAETSRSPLPPSPRHPSRHSVTAAVRAGVDFYHLSVSSFDLRNVIIFQAEDEQTQISVVRLESWTRHL